MSISVSHGQRALESRFSLGAFLASTTAGVALIVGLIGLAWALNMVAGGEGRIPPHLFYVPIFVAAARFGAPGAAVASVVSTIAAGPLLPAVVETGEAQRLEEWLSRGVFFLVNGQAVALVMATMRRLSGDLRTSRERIAELVVRVEEREAARREHVAVRERIGRTIAGEAIDVVYQPIADLRTGRVVGVEALSRFREDPPRPDLWFEQAWSAGLGVELEVLTLRLAAAGFASLPDDVYISLNLSPAVIASPDLHLVLESLPASRVVLEITEHVRIEDYEEVRAPLTELRRRGVRLAIDDVGAGFASLRHILQMEPDIIKLDRDLNRNIDGDEALRALAAALTSFATHLGAQIVAEGIERVEELETLRDLGVVLGQGFLLARPAPMAELDIESVRSLARSDAV